jgi:hypothetical protein
MLTGMDQSVLNVFPLILSKMDGVDDGCNFHEIGSRSGNEVD